MQLKNLSMSFSTQKLFTDININIQENKKIGVVGMNGAGKTTLFKIIMKLVEPDSGRVIVKNGTRIEWLPQVIDDSILDMNISVFDYLLDARPIEKLNNELTNLYNELGNPTADIKNIYKKIDNVELKLNYWDSYNADSILLKIVHGMNISDDVLFQKLNELSGGQKSKIAFARLLYSKPEIMLLDEPTNHLDIDTKNYIINYLKNYKGTVLIISHDQKFLDEITDTTLFLDKKNHIFELYDGNYSYYKKVYTKREENLKHLAELQEEKITKLTEIVNHYSNSSGKRKRMAQDREKKLEKLMSNRIKVDEPNKYMKLDIEMNRESANIPLKISNLYFKYDKDYLIENLNFNIYRGEKFLVVGENGVGKSTLLKLIVSELKPTSGNITIENKTDIAYYAQELELLDNNKTIMENFSDIDKSERQIRNILGRFLFYNDDVFKEVKKLSPGERCRVALAKLSISGANFMVLDEPTNHLDPETQNIISDVFKEFKGTLMVVSHNPSFVDNLGIERMLILPSAKIEYYDKNIIMHYHELNNKKRI